MCSSKSDHIDTFTVPPKQNTVNRTITIVVDCISERWLPEHRNKQAFSNIRSNPNADRPGNSLAHANAMAPRSPENQIMCCSFGCNRLCRSRWIHLQ